MRLRIGERARWKTIIIAAVRTEDGLSRNSRMALTSSFRGQAPRTPTRQHRQSSPGSLRYPCKHMFPLENSPHRHRAYMDRCAESLEDGRLQTPVSASRYLESHKSHESDRHFEQNSSVWQQMDKMAIPSRGIDFDERMVSEAIIPEDKFGYWTSEYEGHHRHQRVKFL